MRNQRTWTQHKFMPSDAAVRDGDVHPEAGEVGEQAYTKFRQRAQSSPRTNAGRT